MDDFRSDRHPVLETDGREVFLQEPRAARDVRAGEFGAVGLVIVRAPEISDVVEQPDDESDDRSIAAEPRGFGLRALVPHDEACQRERDVQGVLPVVIYGVHAEIAGDFAGEQPLEMLERRMQRVELKFRPDRPIKLLDSLENRLR